MTIEAKDLATIRRWAGLVASGTVEQMRDACRENDRNGFFDECSAEDCTMILVAWMAELLEVLP